MAKRGRKAKIKPTPQGASDDDFRKAIEEINRQKANASEYAGHAGAAVKNAVERFGFDRKALTFTATLVRTEENKRIATAKAIVKYMFQAGVFDQLDAFDDFAQDLEDIADHIRGNDNDRKPDEAVTGLVN